MVASLHAPFGPPLRHIDRIEVTHLRTRGQIKNAGRGQTHKVKILELWLDRQNYDKIALWAHHSVQAIKRYVSTFLRVVTLHCQGCSLAEIAFLLNASQRLVLDYLHCRLRLRPP